MPSITATLPPVGLKAYFSFKDPIAGQIRSKLITTDTKIPLEVTSVSSMIEMRTFDMRNPYTYVYMPLGLTETDFDQDYANDVSIITFRHLGPKNTVSYVRVPLNYISQYSETLDITYMNKCLVIDLGKQHTLLDTTVVFSELSDVILSKLGIICDMKEVQIGEVDVLTQIDHESLETVRQNAITVRKPLSVKYEELAHAHSQLLARLQALNITLE